MNEHTPSHSPTAEFRAALERDIVAAFRRERRFGGGVVRRTIKRFSVASALAAGLVLGVGGQFAMGQVQKTRERSELESILASKRELAGVRLDLARTAFELARRQFDVGAVSRPSLLAAEADLRAAEAAGARLNLDLAEIRATANAPRDEIWAPLVDGRDFVKERLTVDAAAVQQRLRSVEDAAAEAERGFKVGTVGALARDEAASLVAQTKAEFDLLAQKLVLRRQFFEERLAPEEAERRLQRAEITGRIIRVQHQARLAEERLKLLRERRAAGAATEVEVLRAQVDMIDRTTELRQLQLQLQRLSPSKE